MRPADLQRLRVPSDPRLHPDGTRVAFVVSRMDLEADRYHRSIFLWDGEEARRFTAGPGDTSPRWSPDGTRLAFLRQTADGDGAQVAVMATDGGEPEVVTDFAIGVRQLEWSPDGTRLAVVALTWAPGWEDLDDDERARRPRRIVRHRYRFDNQGWLFDRLAHLWLVDPTGGDDPIDLTPGAFHVEAFAWSPDGTRLAYLSDHDERQIASGTQVWEVSVEGGEAREVAPRAYWGLPSYRPDGVLHLVGTGTADWPRNQALWRRDGEEWTNLTGHLDRSLVSLSAGPPRLEWDGEDAITGLEDSGRFSLIRVRPDGTTDLLVGGERLVTGFDHRAGTTVAVISEPTSPGELTLLDGDDEVRLTSFGTEGIDLVRPEHFHVVSDGVEVDVWVYLPEGTDPVPTLLNIHGGPASQYGYGFFDEFQIYAGAGYGVVAANPRGSSGRGEAFLRAVVGDGWGVVDRHDIIHVLGEALERFPRLDPTRVGVMGGSYGGFLTAWLIAHEPERFSSAVVERALLTFPSFAGTSDIGTTFPEHYLAVGYPEGWQRWWERSPLSVAHRIVTPTLILHSENDFRCPMEQAEQLFTALLRNGTEVEMLRFPGEGHELSRSGKPRHRLERFDAILEWHGRHLGPKVSEAAEDD